MDMIFTLNDWIGYFEIALRRLQKLQKEGFVNLQVDSSMDLMEVLTDLDESDIKTSKEEFNVSYLGGQMVLTKGDEIK